MARLCGRVCRRGSAAGLAAGLAARCRPVECECRPNHSACSVGPRRVCECATALGAAALVAEALVAEALVHPLLAWCPWLIVVWRWHGLKS